MTATASAAAAYLPVEPLLRVVAIERVHNDHQDNYGEGEKRFLGPAMDKALFRAKARGTATVWLVDRVCHALGLHPVQVYGPLWYAADEGDRVGVAEAAKRLGYCRAYICQMCREGLIDAERVGKSWSIPVDEVERLLEERDA